MVPWFVQLPCSLWLSMAPQLPSQPDWRCPSGFRFLISQHQYNQLLNLKEIKSPLLTLEQSKHSHVDYPGAAQASVSHPLQTSVCWFT